LKKKWQEGWLELTAYILMSVMITVFILSFVRRKYDWLILSCFLLLAACIVLLLRWIGYAKAKRRYDLFFEWLTSGMPEDAGIPEEIRDSVSRMRESLAQKSSYEALQAHMEFAMLQNQINPHFLYNTLDAIRSQALLAGADEIADMTGKLSRFFRYGIRNQGDLVPVSEEISNISDYFSIQHYRFGDRFTLSIQDDGSSPFYYIPKMSFQPLVENALYHGLEPKKGNGGLTIHIEKGERILHVRISDDGVGIAETKLKEINRQFRGEEPPPQPAAGKRNGIALYNVNKRLQVLFGEEYGLYISGTEGMGTDVEIRIPLVDDEQRGKYQR